MEPRKWNGLGVCAVVQLLSVNYVLHQVRSIDCLVRPSERGVEWLQGLPKPGSHVFVYVIHRLCSWEYVVLPGLLHRRHTLFLVAGCLRKRSHPMIADHLISGYNTNSWSTKMSLMVTVTVSLPTIDNGDTTIDTPTKGPISRADSCRKCAGA